MYGLEQLEKPLPRKTITFGHSLLMRVSLGCSFFGHEGGHSPDFRPSDCRPSGSLGSWEGIVL